MANKIGYTQLISLSAIPKQVSKLPLVVVVCYNYDCTDYTNLSLAVVVCYNYDCTDYTNLSLAVVVCCA